MKKYFFIIFYLIFSFSFAQNSNKTITAKRIDQAPTIDGELNEIAWSNVEEANNFVMFEPSMGALESPERKTVVKVTYDNEAIYFAAQLFDDNPNEIPKQFGDRDNIGQVDYFQVNINPNNDGQNDTEFIVMITGVQADAKANSGGGRGGWWRKDFSWSAVWYSAVKTTDEGWFVEMKIPYSALRFSNTNVQTWGINFQRKFQRQNEQYSWNPINKTLGTYTQYAGNLEGLENIKPPTRLSFSPYAYSAVTSFDGDTEYDNSAGLDLKYGINESFTLDLTLIPDFGQAAFDDQVLNLGPFEQMYSEKRSFFTEGTDLFNKGRLFYSRRIGNRPIGYYDVDEELTDEEEIIENPSKVNMLNAIKVSGRTKKGLGIGVFNAITEKTSAKIKNMTTDEVRRVVTEPVANYNVLVLDQQFNQNSSISLVNTNVLRSGSFRDANVTALLADISDKGNKYNIDASIKMSSVHENDEKTTGYSSMFRVSKTHGNVQYGIGHWRANDTYNYRDLGFQRQNNYANYFGNISYRTFEPTGRFNSIRISLEGSVRYQNKPYLYATNRLEFSSMFFTKNKLMYQFKMETNLGDQNDFYEPRVDGRFFKENGVMQLESQISTDYRNKFAIDVEAMYAYRYDDPARAYGIEFSPRYRFSDKFMIIYKLNYGDEIEDLGYVNELSDGSIIFGNRDLKTITNSISSKLSFNTKSSLALSFRHYWSPVDYDDNFYVLNELGRLENHSYTENHDINYNIWNLDLSYSWEFAPGSQLVALYRNSIFNSDEFADLNFNENLDNLFNEPVTNNFSLKFIYYLDYNKLKNWL